MTFPIYQIVFFFFATVTIGAASMVIFVRNPVHAILWLVLTFVAAAGLWMLLQAEFLSLVLIFVYVGAVMTLFLFVVMMLNLDLAPMREGFVRYLPWGLLIMILLVGFMVIIFNPRHFASASTMPIHYGTDYSNVKTMGTELYTMYIFPFELAAAILLVAIVAAIALAFQGRKPNTKTQRIAEQHRATKSERLKIVPMQSEKP